jgi:hypothetical protein
MKPLNSRVRDQLVEFSGYYTRPNNIGRRSGKGDAWDVAQEVWDGLWDNVNRSVWNKYLFDVTEVQLDGKNN